jgi:hypothetical protein
LADSGRVVGRTETIHKRAWEAALHSTDLSIQIVNDKGRYHSRLDPFASPAFVWLWLLAEGAAPPLAPNVTADQKTP